MSTDDKQGKLSIWVQDLVALLRRWREYHRMDADIEGSSMKADLFREGDALLAQDGRWNYFPKLEAIATLESVASATEEKIDKLTWQVRDTCARAEKAEGALRLAQSALRQWTDLYAHLQNECGPVISRKLDYNLPPANHLNALEAIEEHFKPSYVGEKK